MIRSYLPALVIGAIGIGLTALAANTAWEHERDRVSGEIQRRISAHFQALQHGITARIKELGATGLLLSTAGERASSIFTRVTVAIGAGTEDGPWAVMWRPSIRDNGSIMCLPLINCLAMEEKNVPRPDDVVPPLSENAARAVAFDLQPGVPAILVSRTVPFLSRLDFSDNGEERGGGRIEGIYKFGQLVESVLREFTVPSGLNLHVRAPGRRADEPAYYTHWSRTGGTSSSSPPIAYTEGSDLNRRKVTLGGETWDVFFEPTPQTLQDLREGKGIAILLLGLLTTGVLVAYAVSWIHRQAKTEAIVLVRTEDLAEAEAEARRANEGKSRFLAAASHDLRQPLQAARNFATTLSFLAKDDDTRKVVSRLIRSLDSTDGLLTTLLDISRLDTGALVPKLQNFPTDDRIGRLVAEFSPLAAEKGLCLSSVACRANVRSDPVLFDQILRNLISNAVRYTDRGRVLVGCRRRGKNLSIEVHDTGIGIAVSDRERIYQEFHQVQKPTDGEGLGLGLAIARRTARLLSHDLVLVSRVGSGTSFRFVVPRVESAES